MTDFPPPGPSGSPPPGAQPPGPPPPGYGAPPGYGVPPGQPPGPYPVPGMSGARPPVQQPGVVPLRPLTLGDLFGGATLTIRRNPFATVGLAALVTLGFMVLPILMTVLLGATDGLPSFDLDSSSDPTQGWQFSAATWSGALFSWLASVVVTGLIMRVVEQAVVGRRLRGAEAWQRSRGRLLALLGFSLLAGLVMVVLVGVPIGVGVLVGVVSGSTPLTVVLGILGGLLGVVGAVFVYVRYLLLAPPNLVIEGNGVLASMSRAGQLSRGQFWRLLGIALLAALAASLVGQLVAVPFAIVGVVFMFVLPGSWAMVAFLLATYLSSVVAGSITSPFIGGVTALQYYDQRFRKEGHDIELLEQALRQSGQPSSQSPGQPR